MATSDFSKEGLNGNGCSKPINIDNVYVLEDIQIILRKGSQTLKVALFDLLSSPNLCEKLSDKQLAALNHLYDLLNEDTS